MQNPFYNASSGSAGAPPPTYSSRPTPARPAAQTSISSSAIGPPAQYSSLADLTKNKPVPPPRPGTTPGFSYTPDPSRIGYRPDSFESGGEAGPARADGRRMPPPPSNQGLGLPSEPPRRVVSPQPGQAAAAGTAQSRPTAATGPASYIPASAQGYANTASSYATAGVGKAREGIDSMFTQQRREQVTSNLGKAAAGGAKLLGKGAWQLGKFAANPTGK